MLYTYEVPHTFFQEEFKYGMEYKQICTLSVSSRAFDY